MSYSVSCGKPGCKQQFGFGEGGMEIITAGKATYVFQREDVVGVRCECNSLRGSVAIFAGRAQEIRCPNPNCKEHNPKLGELHADGILIKTKRVTIFAKRLIHMNCRCGYGWTPQYVPVLRVGPSQVLRETLDKLGSPLMMQAA